MSFRRRPGCSLGGRRALDRLARKGVGLVRLAGQRGDLSLYRVGPLQHLIAEIAEPPDHQQENDDENGEPLAASGGFPGVLGLKRKAPQAGHSGASATRVGQIRPAFTCGHDADHYALTTAIGRA